MNYLAHFYLDHTDPRPHFTAGVVLPDLARSFGSQYRITALQNLQYPPGNPLHHLNQGVARHHHADHLFHTSEFFTRHFAAIKSRLYAARLQSIPKYTYFVAHVLLEMLLDRLLMKQHPNLCASFYQNLANSDTDTILNYLQLCGIQPQTARLFIQHFERFCSLQYLYQYQHNTGLLYGLERMYLRITASRFSEEDKLRLEDCIAASQTEMEATYYTLFSPGGALVT